MSAGQPRHGTNVRVRQHQVAVRLSPAEEEAVTAAAGRDGISPAAVLRNAFLASVTPQPDEVTERLMHLRALFADLDNHIGRRAEEIAGPLVEQAANKAREMVARAEESARAEITRLQDVSKELRRHIRAADKYRDDVQRYRDRLAAALGRHPSTPWPSLVAEVESRLKEKSDG